HLANHRGGNVANVTLARRQLFNLGAVDVKTNHRKSFGRKTAGQRQAHVTKADDPHSGVSRANFRKQLFLGARETSLRKSILYGRRACLLVWQSWLMRSDDRWPDVGVGCTHAVPQRVPSRARDWRDQLRIEVGKD